jgi:hypothetical protein
MAERTEILSMFERGYKAQARQPCVFDAEYHSPPNISSHMALGSISNLIFPTLASAASLSAIDHPLNIPRAFDATSMMSTIPLAYTSA